MISTICSSHFLDQCYGAQKSILAWLPEGLFRVFTCLRLVQRASCLVPLRMSLQNRREAVLLYVGLLD